MSSIRRFAAVLPISLVAFAFAACGDSDDVEETATPTPTATEVSTSPSRTSTSIPTEPSVSPTESPTAETYVDPRFGYSVELPTGWRPAGAFMDAFAATGAYPQGGGHSRDYLVLTGLPEQEEISFVENASSIHGGLTGVEQWLEFFLLGAIEVFPTEQLLSDQLGTVVQGNVKHVVTDIRDATVGNGETATRYTIELQSDYGHFIYDTVFVPSPVPSCQSCTGYILQAAMAGRSLQTPGPTEPPPAAYPVDQFEAIVRSFLPESHVGASRGAPSDLPYAHPSILSGPGSAPVLSSDFSIDEPAGWRRVEPFSTETTDYVAWLDVLASATPPSRGSLAAGSKIQLQRLHGVTLPINVHDFVAHNTTGNPAAGEVLDSGMLLVDGNDAFYARFTTTDEGGTVNVTSIAWQDKRGAWFLTLACPVSRK